MTFQKSSKNIFKGGKKMDAVIILNIIIIFININIILVIVFGVEFGPIHFYRMHIVIELINGIIQYFQSLCTYSQYRGNGIAKSPLLRP